MDNVSVMLEMKEINMEIFKAVSKRYKSKEIGVTPAQGRIIMYIYDSPDEICQKDIERHISVAKSTISTILNTMEKNNLIVRKCIDGDLRRNVITLTEKALKVADMLRNDEKYFDEILLSGVSYEELQNFYRILGKIRKNIERI